MPGTLISDDFANGKAKATKLEDLSDRQLLSLIAAGSKDAAATYAARVKAKRR